MRIGQSHTEVAIILLGAFSRWINHLDDNEVQLPKTRVILKALSMRDYPFHLVYLLEIRNESQACDRLWPAQITERPDSILFTDFGHE